MNFLMWKRLDKQNSPTLAAVSDFFINFLLRPFIFPQNPQLAHGTPVNSMTLLIGVGQSHPNYGETLN